MNKHKIQTAWKNHAVKLGANRVLDANCYTMFDGQSIKI
jgi:hypothetical protein